MALTLNFTVTERGDNKLLTVTDTTGVYNGVTNLTGWGAPNPAVTDVDATPDTLTLDIVFTGSDGSVTSYDTVELYTEFGPFTTVADLVFPLDCTMLLDDGVAIGTADDEFPDGLYQITYSWRKGQGGTETDTEATALIDGVVKNAIYELLRTIPTKYECEDSHEGDILDIIFTKGYYDAMIATAVVGREDSVINQLLVLERLVVNGSNNNW